MRKLLLCTMIVFLSMALSACGTSTIAKSQTVKTVSQANTNTGNSSSPAPSQHPVTQNTQSNIENSPDPTAENTIKQFYQDLNEKKYSSAVALLGPQLEFEGSPNFIKYLKNLKYTTFNKLIDISGDPGELESQYQQYYKVKVYYGELNIEVQDPDLVAGLGGESYRRFILIKKSKQGPWLINVREATPKR